MNPDQKRFAIPSGHGYHQQTLTFALAGHFFEQRRDLLVPVQRFLWGFLLSSSCASRVSGRVPPTGAPRVSPTSAPWLPRWIAPPCTPRLPSWPGTTGISPAAVTQQFLSPISTASTPYHTQRSGIIDLYVIMNISPVCALVNAESPV